MELLTWIRGKLGSWSCLHRGFWGETSWIWCPGTAFQQDTSSFVAGSLKECASTFLCRRDATKRSLGWAGEGWKGSQRKSSVEIRPLPSKISFPDFALGRGRRLLRRSPAVESWQGRAALGEGFVFPAMGLDPISSPDTGAPTGLMDHPGMMDVLPMEAPGSAPRDRWIPGWVTRSSLPFPRGYRDLAQPHPKKSQDSLIHLLRFHEDQILSGKTHQAWKTRTNPTLPIIRLLCPQGTGADSTGNSKMGQFQDSAPKSTLKPHQVEPTEQGRNNTDAMRIHGNKTRPPQRRARG